jgi:outer membrane immunogenic protein
MSRCVTVIGPPSSISNEPSGAIGNARASGPIPPPIYAPAVVYNWSGFYIGGNLGAAFDPNNLSIKDLSGEQDLSLKFSNETELLGGAHAGYNLQMGSWVVGLEGDFDFAKDVNYLASVRGRLGWALGSWLPYATAGVAFIDADNNFSWFPPMTAPSTSTPALPTRVSSLAAA